MDKKRYKELTKIAEDVYDLLDKSGVKQGEGCVVRMSNQHTHQQFPNLLGGHNGL